MEADETYIGGKTRNLPKHKRDGVNKFENKHIVLGIAERGGKIIAKPIKRASGKDIGRQIRRYVRSGSALVTDENPSYNHLGDDYYHHAVNHSAQEYVRGNVHTNTIEGFWSLFKRGYHGTHHHLSRQHLHRYTGEFAGRQSMRKEHTNDRMRLIARGLLGKSLSYKELVR